jgi:hypothetical protein
MTIAAHPHVADLTREQVMHFHRYGFLTLDRITTPTDLKRIQELLQGLFDRFDTLPKEMALDLGDVKTHEGKQTTPQINQAISFEARLAETD